MPKRIYIEQFSHWWMFTADQFKHFLEIGDKQEWFLNDLGKKLSRRPKSIGAEPWNDGERYYDGYYSRTDAAIFFTMPCDWNADEWQLARQRFAEFQKGGSSHASSHGNHI